MKVCVVTINNRIFSEYKKLNTRPEDVFFIPFGSSIAGLRFDLILVGATPLDDCFDSISEGQKESAYKWLEELRIHLNKGGQIFHI